MQPTSRGGGGLHRGQRHSAGVMALGELPAPQGAGDCAGASPGSHSAKACADSGRGIRRACVRVEILPEGSRRCGGPVATRRGTASHCTPAASPPPVLDACAGSPACRGCCLCHAHPLVVSQLLAWCFTVRMCLEDTVLASCARLPGHACGAGAAAVPCMPHCEITPYLFAICTHMRAPLK